MSAAPSGAGSALRVVDIGVAFGAGAGLSGVSFDVGAGERFVIVGASGAGKTTLLRAIAGLAPATGRVEVAGRDVSALPSERRDAVYLHQTPVLFPHLSVFENVAFPLRVRQASEASVRGRVREVLAAVRLDGFESRAPRTLSGGQRHRVALARAVAARPAVLLLDEPLAALDPSLRGEVREAIVAAQREYRPALVLVTHDLDEAGLLADRVAVLVDRRIAQVAAPAELFARPASLAAARFLGVANEVAGRVRGDGAFESPLGVLPLEGRGAMAGPAVAVFRPDAVRRVTPPEAGVAVRVVGHRHRAQRTSAVVALAGATLELPVDPLDIPPVGAELRVVVEPRLVTVFPVDAGPPAPT